MSLEENRRKTWAFFGVFVDREPPKFRKWQRDLIAGIDGPPLGPKQQRKEDARRLKIGLCTACGRPLKIVSFERESRTSSWRCDHCALDFQSPDERGNLHLLRLAEARAQLKETNR